MGYCAFVHSKVQMERVVHWESAEGRSCVDRRMAGRKAKGKIEVAVAA